MISVGLTCVLWLGQVNHDQREIVGPIHVLWLGQVNHGQRGVVGPIEQSEV
jgi:hypothetical protein